MTEVDEGGGRPRYVAIITDGNGRWARARDLPVVEGHKAGADIVKARLRDAAELGVRELTVYSFSTENWTRPAEEVAGLMRMFSQRILSETPELKEEGVRMRFIGRRERVATALRVHHWNRIADAMAAERRAPRRVRAAHPAGRTEWNWSGRLSRRPARGRPRAGRSTWCTSIPGHHPVAGR